MLLSMLCKGDDLDFARMVASISELIYNIAF